MGSLLGKRSLMVEVQQGKASPWQRPDSDHRERLGTVGHFFRGRTVAPRCPRHLLIFLGFSLSTNLRETKCLGGLVAILLDGNVS